ncbi:Si-specific NAD(P)(+) transhydrogenase [Aureimonas leprariae]|uniref:Soluble pyridine nucleotide transhydrogenase n=1 Tax=Plantimonas leprariae TaxID=2615207 RepID=A0A7V7PP42_9HYPH|nr:Si-specific NAD(P)(+) transhydrogenase [Aureimonas leprariae]KAB0679622.1 Si-specific NAD(P)(+) transhydrogenase [Aureimonas leprariae]
MTRFDLIVIGSGPSGRRAAVQAAKLGKTVLVVEKRERVGGVSVHTGTIPSKSLRETVLNLTGWRERGFYGSAYRVKKDISAADLRVRGSKILEHEVDVLDHQFARNRVATLTGEARFLDPNHIVVTRGGGAEPEHFEADRFVIACGTRPHRPANIPFDGRTVIDSDEILKLETLPRSMTVVGAGVIGVEYATIFSALEIAVTLVEPRATFLDFIDREMIEEFVHELRDRNVSLRLGAEVTAVEFDHAGRPVCRIASGRDVTSDVLLYAAGRMGSTDGLDLDKAGLETDNRGRLTVDPKTLQTAVPHIYAAGDVIGFPSLASTSMEQGRFAACHAFGLEPTPLPDHFPYGIYAVPEMSTVGMSEEDVKKRQIPYECGIARFRETSRGHIMGLQTGMMKMIFSKKTRRVLGVHIIGEGATELIHIGQAVMALKGTIDYFMESTFNYPTLAEAYKIAALDAWNRAFAPSVAAPETPGMQEAAE